LKEKMKNITIQVDIPSDMLVALNESEKELKSHFQTATAMMLFQEGKLTIGKAIQLSGLTRFEFEKALAKNNIPVSVLDEDIIWSDIEKLRDI
jgi:predicted HTH domain antitoxin